MVLDYIKKILVGWRTETKDYGNITFRLQKQILKRRYTEGKQNKSYKNQPKFGRSAVRYIDLIGKDTKNVILFKKEKLRKLS